MRTARSDGPMALPALEFRVFDAHDLLLTKQMVERHVLAAIEDLLHEVRGVVEVRRRDPTLDAYAEARRAQIVRDLQAALRTGNPVAVSGNPIQVERLADMRDNW